MLAVGDEDFAGFLEALVGEEGEGSCCRGGGGGLGAEEGAQATGAEGPETGVLEEPFFAVPDCCGGVWERFLLRS